MTFMTEWTEEDQARADAREAAERAEALAALRDLLITDGLAPDDADRTLVAVERVLHPRIEKMYGVLDGTMLAPLYAYANPWRNDPDMPGWQEYEDRATAAREAARHYQIVRLSTGWIEAPE